MILSSKPVRDACGYVLAGGRSSRMGQDKAFLHAGNGELLIEHALRRLREICTDVAILSGPARFERDALLSRYARPISDVNGDSAGPLAGLAAALADASTPFALLLAIDQPQVPSEALQMLVEAVRESDAAAVCFTHSGRAEPLPLLVSRSMRPAIEGALARGGRKFLSAVQDSASNMGRELLQIEIPPSSAAVWFTNLNTPEDLLQWRAVTRQNQSGQEASETSNG